MKSYPKLLCLKTLNTLMRDYHALRRNVPEGRLVAYVTSGAPVEILEAAGIVTVYPENYGALCGTLKRSTQLGMEAESAGFARDLCSYAKGHVGAVLSPNSAPLGGLPKPDMLLCCNNICGTVLPWYQYLSEVYSCPVFFLDVPFGFTRRDEYHVVRYVKEQMKELILWVEHRTRKQIDETYLRSVMARSRDAVDLWTEIRKTGRNKPSPIHVQDLSAAMAPVVVLRGIAQAVDFYRLMLEELEERKLHGISAVPGERVRLLWDNIAVWCDTPRLYRFFADQDVSLVADTYTGAWSVPLDLEDPMEGLARAYAAPYINLNLEER